MGLSITDIYIQICNTLTRICYFKKIDYFYTEKTISLDLINFIVAKRICYLEWSKQTIV